MLKWLFDFFVRGFIRDPIEKAIQKYIQDWVKKPPFRPIFYGPFARFSDWSSGGRDGKRGHPDVSHMSSGPAATGVVGVPQADGHTTAGLRTPGSRSSGERGSVSMSAVMPLMTFHMRYLLDRGLGLIDNEWLVYQAKVADPLDRLSNARSRRAQCQVKFATKKQRLVQLAPTQEELEQRWPGDDRMPMTVVRRRNLDRLTAERAPAVRQTEAEVGGLQKELEECDVAIAAAAQQVRLQFEVAKKRARRIEHHIGQRWDKYLRRLSRAHPDGNKIIELMRSVPHVWPEWVGFESPPELAEPPDSANGSPAGVRTGAPVPSGAYPPQSGSGKQPYGHMST